MSCVVVEYVLLSARICFVCDFGIPRKWQTWKNTVGVKFLLVRFAECWLKLLENRQWKEHRFLSNFPGVTCIEGAESWGHPGVIHMTVCNEWSNLSLKTEELRSINVLTCCECNLSQCRAFWMADDWKLESRLLVWLGVHKSGAPSFSGD